MIPRACPACRFLNLEGLSVCMSCAHPLGAPKVGIDAVLAAQRARRKAARKAEVRRLVRESGPMPLQPADRPEPVVDVVQPDPIVRGELMFLLRSFGFKVRAFAFDVPLPAEPLGDEAPPDVVIIDVTAQSAGGDDGIEICRRWSEAFESRHARAPAWLITAQRVRPKDRVRAILVGGAELVIGELSRGVVAAALNRTGIALPRDPRALR